MTPRRVALAILLAYFTAGVVAVFGAASFDIDTGRLVTTLNGNGQTVTFLASVAIRDTSAAFDVTLAATSSTTLTAGQTLTLNVGNAAHTLAFGTTANTITFPSVASDTVVMATATQTLTNKRINPRIGSEASSSTSTPTADTVDEWEVTALAANDTFAAPTGTPVDGQKLIIRIKDNGTARTLAWNAIYRAGTDVALPTTTVISKTLYLGFMYNAADSKWDLLAVTGNI